MGRERFGRYGFALLLVLSACSCSNDSGSRPSCPREQAAFRVQVTTRTDSLPEDMALTVLYQGNQSERFSLAAPSADNEDVCCRPGMAKTGPLPEVPCHSSTTVDAGAVDALLCELWTNGVTEVRVTGDDYPPLDEVLEPRPREDDCGLETTDVRLVLEHTDGGLD